MAFRTAVSVLVVLFLLSRVDVGSLKDSLTRARLSLVVLAFAILLVGLVVNAFRWQVFLKPLGLALSVSELIRLTFVGTFFNAFLPTGFGGDAYKSFMMGGEVASMSEPLATVFLDRLAGLVGLSLLALAGSVARFGSGDRGPVTVAASLLSFAILMLSGLALRLAPGSKRRGASSRLGARVRTFARAFATAGRERQAVRRGALVGIASALLLVAVNALLAAALEITVPLSAFAGIVLIATLMTIVPLSINGLGFREGAYVWCLAAYGIGHEQALAFAVLVLAVTLASCAVGGIVYAVAGAERRARANPLARALQHIEDPGDDQQVDPHEERPHRDQDGRRGRLRRPDRGERDADPEGDPPKAEPEARQQEDHDR
jgi:uncharacterized protein (TIRG00374 family)